MRIGSGHIVLLKTLAKTGKIRYSQFRDKYNFWRSNTYFDGQMTQLCKAGYVEYGNRSNINITDAGIDLIENFNNSEAIEG